MKHAWDNYVTYAWGKNELRPMSKRGHTGSIFGSQPLGATILDAIDTLYLMGMNDEFKRARDWLATEFDVDSVVSQLNGNFCVVHLWVRPCSGVETRESSLTLKWTSVFKKHPLDSFPGFVWADIHKLIKCRFVVNFFFVCSPWLRFDVDLPGIFR